MLRACMKRARLTLEISVSSLLGAMKAALDSALDTVADSAAHEAFLRADLMNHLEKSLKQREHKLKKVLSFVPTLLAFTAVLET